jgi:hypothetical protein
MPALIVAPNNPDSQHRSEYESLRTAPERRSDSAHTKDDQTGQRMRPTRPQLDAKNSLIKIDTPAKSLDKRTEISLLKGPCGIRWCAHLAQQKKRLCDVTTCLFCRIIGFLAAPASDFLRDGA